MKELTRDQMKNVKGGDEQGLDPLTQGNKCCWTNDMTNCSICQPGGAASCIAGATAVAC